MAKVTVAFVGVPDGEVYGKEFAPGDEVEGNLAEVAVSEGWAEEAETAKETGGAGEQKGDKSPETKARKAAPENK